MGKSNRIRLNRANEKTVSLGAKSNKGKGMPSWAMTLIAVVMAVALLLSVSCILLSSNGVFGRVVTVVSSDNYSVDANMMSYFFNTEYQNFLSSYETYFTTSEKDGMISYNASIDLDKQQFGGSTEGKTYYDASFFGEFEGTWRDYMVDRTLKSVESLLRYCEYAKANNITLDEDDQATLDANLSTYEYYAAMYGYTSVNPFLSENFGDGVSANDVKKCMELSLLASKAMEDIAEKINDGVLDAEVTERFEKDKMDHLLVDYVYFTLTVNYSDITVDEKKIAEDYLTSRDLEVNDENKAAFADEIKEEVEKAKLAEYKVKVDEKKAEANELKALGDIEAFKSYIYKDAAEAVVKKEYDKWGVNIYTEEEAKYFRDKVVEDVVKEILEGKTSATDVVTLTNDESVKEFTAYDKTVNRDFIKVLNSVKSATFTAAAKASSYIKENQKYKSEEDKISVWAFADDRKVGDTMIEETGDGSDTSKEFGNASGKYQADIYCMENVKHKDTTLSRNFGYMVFATEDAAKEAITAIKAGNVNTTDAFKKIAEEKEAEFISVTDYEKGSWNSDDFDTWLFHDTRVAGSVNETPIKVKVSDEQNGYVVAIYEGTGHEAW